MNKYSNIRSGLFAAVFTGGLLFSAGSAFAADNGSVVISGTVEAVNEITASTELGASLTSAELLAGVTAQVVSVVNEKNNSDAGYTVSLASAKAVGAQAHLGGVTATNIINYSITYGGSPVTLVEGGATVTADGTNTGENGVTNNLEITTTAGWHNADIYSDTLTLTIASK